MGLEISSNGRQNVAQPSFFALQTRKIWSQPIGAKEDFMQSRVVQLANLR